MQVVWGDGLRVRRDKYFELKVFLQDVRSEVTMTESCATSCYVLMQERGSCLTIQSCGSHNLLV